MGRKELTREELRGITLDLQVWLGEEGCMGPAWDRAALGLDRLIAVYGATGRQVGEVAARRGIVLTGE